MSNTNKQTPSETFTPPATSSVQDQLAALQVQELAERLRKEREEKEYQETMRQANIESLRKDEARREASQAACPHMKPNFTPAIGGQRDHRGNFHYICQYCGKEFGNNL